MNLLPLEFTMQTHSLPCSVLRIVSWIYLYLGSLLNCLRKWALFSHLHRHKPLVYKNRATRQVLPRPLSIISGSSTTKCQLYLLSWSQTAHQRLRSCQSLAWNISCLSLVKALTLVLLRSFDFKDGSSDLNPIYYLRHCTHQDELRSRRERSRSSETSPST